MLSLSLSVLVKILGPEDGPECGLGQQLGAVVSVLHVGHAHRGIADPVVDHRVHGDRHAVLGENLLGDNIEDLGPQVDGGQFVNAGQDEVKTRGPRLAVLDPSQSEDDRPLVLLDTRVYICIFYLEIITLPRS